jgi:uncharacterized protein (DUF488 family)
MKEIFTIGHSTRTAEGFLSLLETHGIRAVADVRTVPRSRRHPQFESAALAEFLRDHAIGYRHFPGLGGLRRPRKDSPNTGWRNASFRGYADHMATASFREGLRELEIFAGQMPAGIMCAEAVPWRCHRSLIADALDARGWTVLHVTGGAPAKRHAPTPFLRVEGEEFVYKDPDIRTLF